MSSRRDKLVALREFVDLETGKVLTDSFTYENTLYKKAVKMKTLAAKIRRCRKCPGLNVKRFTEACPGWGNLNSSIFFVGQSLHKPGVSSGLPFILGSGYCIDAALRLSGLLRKDVFFSNVVHCHPEGNRTSTQQEKDNCLGFLIEELEIVQPRMIVALGNDAKSFVNNFIIGYRKLITEAEDTVKVLKIKHPASFMYSAPEERIDWIVKLSLEMDRCLKKIQRKPL